MWKYLFDFVSNILNAFCNLSFPDSTLTKMPYQISWHPAQHCEHLTFRSTLNTRDCSLDSTLEGKCAQDFDRLHLSENIVVTNAQWKLQRTLPWPPHLPAQSQDSFYTTPLDAVKLLDIRAPSYYRMNAIPATFSSICLVFHCGSHTLCQHHLRTSGVEVLRCLRAWNSSATVRPVLRGGALWKRQTFAL